jgi:signal transduction histidine kinase
MNSRKTYKIRPAGRHILTIGRDLIRDQYGAIVELVKNAFDADSPDVLITFKVPEARNTIQFIVEDHGHGMTFDTVINKWLVPSTDDKLARKTSPGGRVMQGRKGIGRYAAAKLGYDLLVETITEDGQKTTVYLEWDKFEKAEYLDEVDIIVDTSLTELSCGTTLTITGGKEHLAEWEQKKHSEFKFELKKLISPFSETFHNISEDEEDLFSIILKYDGFWEGQTNIHQEEIEPFPLLDFFDYQIAGVIETSGNGNFTFVNQKAKNTITEHFDVVLDRPTECGRLEFDIRVYDREPQAIDQLIQRGLKDEYGNYVKKNEARNLLNVYSGIGVYRNGFRIRPLGNPEFDWLALNKRRVQNPSQCIGSDQAIGYIQIQSEEHSNLEEKSARDGLKENNAYIQLTKIVIDTVLNELEKRRFLYRSKAGLSRSVLKVEREFERLFSFDDLKQGIRSKLKKSSIPASAANLIIEIIEKEEKEKNRIADDIRKTVAIYQGQATLGKIINVVLHEGRKPLNFFKNQIPNLDFWASEIKNNYDPSIFDELIPISEGLGRNADIFVKLFSRLDPLAAGKRKKRKDYILEKIIEGAFMVFENELIRNGIAYEINCPEKFSFSCWHQDLYIIFTNLIDNSFFWMVEKNSPRKKISVTVTENDNRLIAIDYRDTGPGIESHLIESGVIFEPEFTTKPDGTGLGLAIAGEASMRNGLELRAFDSDKGAYFRIQPIIEE